MTEDTATRLMESIAANRLSVLCGAGLSMAAPSSLPSAARIASDCATAYQQKVGQPLPPEASGDIEKMALWFRSRNQFDGLFIRTLVPWWLFKAAPNTGHEAVADFLGCGVVREVVTTNFDRLVESAADSLGEPMFRAIADVLDLGDAPEHRPYLKVHGCMDRSPVSTIWCKEQFDDAPLNERANRFRDWMVANLVGRDILIVGFWTDWAYLSDIFSSALPAIGPRTLVLVDPMPGDQLEAKAPELWRWAHAGGVTFIHEPESGDSFLDSLRKRVSKVFLNRIFDESATAYNNLFGEPPRATARNLDAKTSPELYGLRRDLTGVPRHRPVREREPKPIHMPHAAMHQRLLDKGAHYEAHSYRLNGDAFRVVSGHGRVLSEVKQSFSTEPPLPISLSRVVCIGALNDGGAAPNVVRPDERPTILTSGTVSNWVSHENLVSELRVNGG